MTTTSTRPEVRLVQHIWVLLFFLFFCFQFIVIIMCLLDTPSICVTHPAVMSLLLYIQSVIKQLSIIWEQIDRQAKVISHWFIRYLMSWSDETRSMNVCVCVCFSEWLKHNITRSIAGVLLIFLFSTLSYIRPSPEDLNALLYSVRFSQILWVSVFYCSSL